MWRKLQEWYSSKEAFGEMVRFVIVGCMATALQYLFYLICLVGLKLRPEVAAVISYMLSFLCNFMLTNYFTFRTKPSVEKGVGFLMSHAINLGLQVLLVSLFSNVVGEKMALLPSMVICVPINFLMVRFVFKR